MNAKSLSIVSLVAVLSLNTISVSGADDAAQPNLQFVRRGDKLYIRKIERPALIERLVKTADPVELQPLEVISLEAFLTANSRPRRLYRDGFYSEDFATRGTDFDDPVNRSLVANPAVNREEWQRLRTHLLFNRMLVAQKQAKGGGEVR